MRRRPNTESSGPRRGAAATELAATLPVFLFLFVLAVDFGRVFYGDFIVINAARCGALYGSTDPTHALNTVAIGQNALADAGDLDPLLFQVTSTSGTDSAGNPCIDVSTSYQFQTVTKYLIPTYQNVACRVRMDVAPVLPNFN